MVGSVELKSDCVELGTSGETVEPGVVFCPCGVGEEAEVFGAVVKAVESNVEVLCVETEVELSGT